MTITIINSEIIEQHGWEQHPIVETAKKNGGVAYRVEFEYEGHKAVMLSCLDKELVKDADVSIDNVFVTQAEMWIKDNPPPRKCLGDMGLLEPIVLETKQNGKIDK